jgi:hypothetical protein
MYKFILFKIETSKLSKLLTSKLAMGLEIKSILFFINTFSDEKIRFYI